MTAALFAFSAACFGLLALIQGVKLRKANKAKKAAIQRIVELEARLKFNRGDYSKPSREAFDKLHLVKGGGHG